MVNPESQARILTGSALFGVIVVVLLHEFGHWLTGLVVTGRLPDFYLVAVRQKVEQFSTAGGIVTWGAGPAVQLAVLWVFVLLASARGTAAPRLMALTGGALIFSLVTHVGTWAFAGFSSTESWGNDIPRVATFFGSTARIWMHLLNAAFFAAILTAGYRWWKLVRVARRPSMHVSTSIIGAIEGGVLVVIVTVFVGLTT